MRRHNQKVYRAARAILRDESDVEDVLQEAYLAAYRHLEDFEGRSRFSTWLVRIAVNKALERRRRRARVVVLDPGAEEFLAERAAACAVRPAAMDPESSSATHELRRLLERAVDGLPESYRTVYVLRDVEGLSTREVASSLGLEENTVKTRLHRARGLLRGALLRDFDAAALHAFPFGAGRCDRLVAAVLERLVVGARPIRAPRARPS